MEKFFRLSITRRPQTYRDEKERKARVEAEMSRLSALFRARVALMEYPEVLKVSAARERRKALRKEKAARSAAEAQLRQGVGGDSNGQSENILRSVQPGTAQPEAESTSHCSRCPVSAIGDGLEPAGELPNSVS